MVPSIKTTDIYQQFYVQMCYRVGLKNIEPFTLSMATFCVDHKIWTLFVKIVHAWSRRSFKKQIILFTKVLKKCKYMQCLHHELLVRNKLVRLCYQRIWVLETARERSNKERHFRIYLKQHGLDKYFKCMQKLGMSFQI